MSITLNLISEKNNVINNFLTKFFEKDMLTDANTSEWSYILPNPLDAVNKLKIIFYLINIRSIVYVYPTSTINGFCSVRTYYSPCNICI